MNIARLVPRLSRSMGGVRGVPSHLPSSARPSLFSTCAVLSAPTPPGANQPASASDSYSAALAKNQQWANKTAKEQPDLFPTLATGQQPEILWLGCSDSRCPETSLLGLQPGDVFVHRNIANVIHTGDISAASVIEFAVYHLKVKHVVLCGHTKCGGAGAAMGNSTLGILDTWLLPLRELREQYQSELQSLSSADATQKLVELNVQDGVKKLKRMGVVLEAIEKRGLQVHGLVYDVGTGLLTEVDTNETDAAIKARLTACKTRQ